jgi:hypothetical protein
LEEEQLTKTSDPIVVRSHVGRDIIQTSQLFKTAEAAVWEYVVNSLEYVDAGIRPEVHVRLDPRNRRIVISDNGRGMSEQDLRETYFVMHAENPDRKRGIGGRGQFGTGKSAAFGIGNRLEVATVRDGIRNVVELRRDDIDRSDGSAVPTHWLVRNEPAPQTPNGTVITCDGVTVRRMAGDPVIKRIERHLPYWRAKEPKVYVDTHLCQGWEPEVAQTYAFDPPAALKGLLGDAKLTVKVARVPLEEGNQGIAITAGEANLVAAESAGVDRKEFGNYLFGSVNVPALTKPAEEGAVAAYDSTRSMQLNYEHPVAGALVGFIGSKLEEVRLKLVDENRQRRREQEAKRLEKTAQEIAKILNDDLQLVADRIGDMRNLQRRTRSIAKSGDEQLEDEGSYIQGGDDDIAGVLGDDLFQKRQGNGEVGKGLRPGTGIKGGEPDAEAAEKVREIGTTGKNRRSTGGLVINFNHAGGDEHRAHYDRLTRTIWINLDHPMLAAAKASEGEEGAMFKRAAHEAALTEYALALGTELYDRNPNLEPTEVLFEVRDAVRRVTSHGGILYAAA